MISCEFMSETDTLLLNPTLDNPYNTLRIGLSDYILNIATFLDNGWFKSKCIDIFGYREYILTQCGIHFSTELFFNFIFKTIVNPYKTFTAKKIIERSNHNLVRTQSRIPRNRF